MRVAIEEFKTRVEQIHPPVAQLDKKLLCFTKRDQKNNPYAIFYLDFGDDLPDSEERVRHHIERIVGQRYFDGNLNLQWNNYVYFIRDSSVLANPSAKAATAIIERDRGYARKFVIPYEDIEDLLNPNVTRRVDNTKQIDVIEDWTAVLQEPNLIEAVLGDYTAPDRMKLVDGTSQAPKQRFKKQNVSLGDAALLPPLREFRLEVYRPCLEGSNFRFADVNLLFGANGSGKTSLLEAIELYYCGKKTKRNPDLSEEYRFVVQVEGEEPRTITHERPVSESRNRSLLWYGIREQKQSRLFDPFGRFNFLNTDAAVDLAKGDGSDFEVDLARLLVGSDAAAIWQVIERLAADVASEVRKEDALQSQLQEELETIRNQLSESATVKNESDSLSTALRDAMQRNEWALGELAHEDTSGDIVKKLSELIGIVRKIAELTWVDSPVTLQKCESYQALVRDTLAKIDQTAQHLEAMETREQNLNAEKNRCQQAHAFLDELGRHFDVGIENRTAELTEQQQIIAKTMSVLAGIDEESIELLRDVPKDASIFDMHTAAVSDREGAEAAVIEAKAKRDRFTRLQERTLALAQELRNLATEIIGAGPADECPLCHTKFASGQLVERMARGLTDQDEAAAQKILSAVSQSELTLQRTRRIESAFGQIGKFCSDAGLPLDGALSYALSKIAELQKTLTEARSRSQVLSTAITSLHAEGFSIERMQFVRTKLSTLGVHAPVESLNEVQSLKAALEEQLRVVAEDANSTGESLAYLRALLSEHLRNLRTERSDWRAAVSETQERLATTEALHTRVTRYLSAFKWPASSPVSEWLVDMEAVLELATKLQTALGVERVAAKTLSSGRQRQNQIEEQSKLRSGRIEQLRSAQRTLSKIENDISLETVTRKALSRNRSVIESIFKQIHSPAEFSGVCSSGKGWALQRKDSMKSEPLTRVSTGQRAAFALSVFLAQNAQLKSGPPVILIDDPIAHVDDLNCLSFLDYLRDVALVGDRQVFFATASDKLASLFERKFGFLGDQFRRINLERAAPRSVS